MKYSLKNVTSTMTKVFLITAAMAAGAFAQQTKTTVVAIDPERNVVRLSNTPEDPVPVNVVGQGTARKPFQMRVRAVLNSGEFKKIETVPLPFGKRFVIENVNAFVTRPTGLQVSVQLIANMDANGDGQLTVDEMGIYFFPTTDEISFSASTEAYANHKTRIFADGNIGNGSQYMTFALTMNGAAGSTSQGVVTLSGYLEDIPAN